MERPPKITYGVQLRGEVVDALLDVLANWLAGESRCLQCGVRWSEHEAGDGLAGCPGDFPGDAHTHELVAEALLALDSAPPAS